MLMYTHTHTGMHIYTCSQRTHNIHIHIHTHTNHTLTHADIYSNPYAHTPSFFLPSLLSFFFLFVLNLLFQCKAGNDLQASSQETLPMNTVIQLGGLRNENLHIERLFNVLEIREFIFHNSLHKYVITGNKSKDLDPFAFRSPPATLEEKRAGHWEAHKGACWPQNKFLWASSARGVQWVCSRWLSDITCDGKGHIRPC